MKLFALALLLPSLALGQGLSPYAPGQRPARFLIPDRSDQVSHVYWDGVALVETKSASTSWSMSGTVPQVAAPSSPLKRKRAGSGPYSASNFYYSSTAALNFYQADVTICAVVKYASSASTQHIVANDAAGSRQFNMDVAADGTAGITFFALGVQALTGAKVTANAANVVCGSYQFVTNGTSVVQIMVNGTYASKTNATGPIENSGNPFNIGRRQYGGFEMPWAGVIYEVAVWRRALTQSEMADIQRRALSW